MAFGARKQTRDPVRAQKSCYVWQSYGRHWMRKHVWLEFCAHDRHELRINVMLIVAHQLAMKKTHETLELLVNVRPAMQMKAGIWTYPRPPLPPPSFPPSLSNPMIEYAFVRQA